MWNSLGICVSHLYATYLCYFTGAGGSDGQRKGKGKKGVKQVSHKRTKYYKEFSEAEHDEEQEYDEADLYARLTNLQTVLNLSPSEYTIMRNLISFDHPKTSALESF